MADEKTETAEEKELRELDQKIREARARAAKVELDKALKKKRLEAAEAMREAEVLRIAQSWVAKAKIVQNRIRNSVADH